MYEKYASVYPLPSVRSQVSRIPWSYQSVVNSWLPKVFFIRFSCSLQNIVITPYSCQTVGIGQACPTRPKKDVKLYSSLSTAMLSSLSLNSQVYNNPSIIIHTLLPFMYIFFLFLFINLV